MKRRKLLLVSAFGAVCGGFMSCTDIDLNDTSKDVLIQESLALPLGEGTVTISDLLKSIDSWQGYYQYNADTVFFETDRVQEYDYAGTDLLKNAHPATFSLQPASATIDPNSVLTLPSNLFSLDIGLNPNSTSNRTDSAQVKAATLDIQVNVSDIKDMNGNNILPSDLKLTLKFPKMHYFNSKAPIVKEMVLSQFGTPTVLTINDFVINCAGMSQIPFEVTVTSGTRKIKTGANAKIQMDVKVSKLDYTVAYGQYDPVAMVPTVLKIPLGVLVDIPLGLKYFNPTGSVTVESNLGTYIRFNVDYVKGLSKGKVMTQATFNGNPSTSEIINTKPSAPGQFASKLLPTIDKDYGAIDKLFDSAEKLDTIEYKFSAYRDEALNASSSTPSYVLPAMKMKVTAKVRIPAYFKPGSSISLTDTLKNISDVISKMKQATLVLKATNNLPLKMTCSLKFLATDGKLINSSVNDSVYVINSASVGATGLVTSPVETIRNISLTAEQTAQVKNAASMLCTLQVSGQDASKSIQITKNDFVKINLGVFGKTAISETIGSGK